MIFQKFDQNNKNSDKKQLSSNFGGNMTIIFFRLLSFTIAYFRLLSPTFVNYRRNQNMKKISYLPSTIAYTTIYCQLSPSGNRP